MNIETVKIPVSDLTLGMLVVRLDRPWLETPFPLQGFRIEHLSELEQLAEYCKHVYIDIENRSQSGFRKYERATLTQDGEIVGANSEFESSAASEARKRKTKEAKTTRIPPPAVEYGIEAGFSDELPRAIEAVGTLKRSLKTFVQNIDRDGRRLITDVRRHAQALEDSMLRNPDPCMLIRALPSDEPFSFRHGVHTAILGIAMGRELGFRRQKIHELTMGTLLADIGKTRLPKELLRAARRLDSRETAIIQLHVKFGVDMAEGLNSLSPETLEIIAAHHERFNGSGYPSGLSGAQIPLSARIVGLIDSFDALTSERAYSEPIPIYEAVQELYAATVDVYQRDLVECLIQALGTHPIGSLVELSDGSVAVVVALNRHRRLLPCVVRLTDQALRPLAGQGVTDLSEAGRKVVTIKDIIDPGLHGVEQPGLAELFEVSAAA